jgi:hypothetical protein
LARHACFCGALRSCKIAFSRLRSEGFTVIDIPLRMRQIRMPSPGWGSKAGFKCQIRSTSTCPGSLVANVSMPRHRFLEIAGSNEIFVPEMTVENPVYHVHASGQHTKLEERDASRICTVCGLTPTRPFSTSKTSRWWLQTTTSPPTPSTTSRFQEGRSCSTNRQVAGSQLRLSDVYI